MERTQCYRAVAVMTSLAAGVSLVNAQTDVADKPSQPSRVTTDTLHQVIVTLPSVVRRNMFNQLLAKTEEGKDSQYTEEGKALALSVLKDQFGTESITEPVIEHNDIDFSYSLQSLWPVNERNAPRTQAEKIGLQFVVENKGKNYYTEETLDGIKYLTAVYPNIAVAPVCASCHNKHKDSPRRDFKLGDVMGGLVIRIPMEGKSVIRSKLNGMTTVGQTSNLLGTR